MYCVYMYICIYIYTYYTRVCVQNVRLPKNAHDVLEHEVISRWQPSKIDQRHLLIFSGCALFVVLPKANHILEASDSGGSFSHDIADLAVVDHPILRVHSLDIS